MKKKHFTLALILALSMTSFANERDDLNFIDELYKQKNFDMAIVESKEFLNKYPDSKYNKNMLDRIAKVYFLQEKYDDAIKYFKILLLNNKISSKEKTEINYYLVRCYAALGDKKVSEEYLHMIDPKNEYYDKAILDSATTYLAKEKYNDAKETYMLIKPDSKFYNDALLNMALLSYNEKQYQNCINYIEKYSNLRGKKRNDFMNYLLGSAYYKLNNIDKAIWAFNKTIDEGNDSPYAQKAILNLVEIYSNKGDIATTESKIALLTNPNDYNEGIRILGDSYATKGQYQKAIECYNKITDLSNPKLLYSYGFSLFKMNRLKEAQNYFESLKTSSYYNQAMYYIFAIDYQLKNYKKILDNKDEIKRVIVNQQDTESINLIIANAAYELGKYELSRDYYGRMYAVNPTLENLYRIIIMDNKIEDLQDMQIRFNEYKNKFAQTGDKQKNIYLAMGELYYKKGKYEEAVNIYKEYLESNQDFDVTNNLITTLLAQQKYDEMMGYLSQLDDSLDNMYLKGVALIGMGKYNEASEYLNKVETDPNVTPELVEKVKINKLRNSFLKDDYSEAIKYGNEYILTYPQGQNLSEALDKTAISYFRIDDFENSRKIYERMKSIPESAEYAQFQIADNYYAQKNYEKALENYSLVAKNFPNGKYTENANYWYLNSLVNLGKIDQFEIEKKAFLNRYPNSTMKENIFILSGQIYEKSGNNEKLLENYKTLYSNAKTPSLKDEAAAKIIEFQLNENNFNEAMKNIDTIHDTEIKSYYTAMILEKQGKNADSIKEYEKLFNGKKYKDFAGMKLGAYYYDKKQYDKAKTYYVEMDKLENSKYKDFVLFQLANINEIQGKNKEAFRGYTKGYVMYKGQYSTISKFKAAQVAEKLNMEKDAEKLYRELYSQEKFEHKKFVLEKLIYFALKRQNKVEAKKYYNELQKLDKKASEKYKQFFN